MTVFPVAMEEAKYLVGLFENRYVYGKLVSKRNVEKGRVKEFTQDLSELIKRLVELSAITKGNSKELACDMLKMAKKFSNQIREIYNDENATNQHITELASNLYIEMRDSLYVLEKDNFQLEDWVLGKQSIIQEEVIEKIGSYFESKREISLFDNRMGAGEYLLAFKRNAAVPYVHTYGTDEDVEACQIGKDNGVDVIAKKGIVRMSNNVFDISMFMMNRFHFFDRYAREENEFAAFLSRKATRAGGYFIFNLPYYKIPRFERKINDFMRVEAILNVGDEIGNLIFVATFRKPDLQIQKKELKKAYMMPQKLASFDEYEFRFLINSGNLTTPEILPDIWEPYLLDERDILDSFKDHKPALDNVMEYYAPKERVVDLNQPLQEYKIGHIPAVATTEITNGIYDTSLHKDMLPTKFNFPHLSSVKIIQQEVKDEETEMKDGTPLEIYTLKKTNIIVAKALVPDGKVFSLLNTK